VELQPVLLVTATLALSLAGFSSVAIAIRHRDPGEWPFHLRVRLQSLVDIGMTVVGLALLPIALFYLGVDEAVLWDVASLVLAVVVTAVMIRIVSRSRSPTRAGLMGKWYPLLSRGVAVAVVTANVMDVVLDLGAPTTYGIYLVSLFALLGIAATMFVRLITFPADEPT
jgi:hypothetical protein